MRQFTSGLCVWLLVSSLSLAQEVKTPTEPKKEKLTAEQVLEAVDKRIYYAHREGLKDLQFDWKLEGTGLIGEQIDPYAIRYTWKAPDRWQTGLVTKAGAPVPETPEVFKTEEGKKLLQSLVDGTHAVAQQSIIGLPLSDNFINWRKELRTRLVNNQIQHRIIFRPKVKKRWREMTMRITKGLPVEMKKTDEKGQVLTQIYLWTERDGKHLLKGMKFELGNRVLMEETFEYAKTKGIYILTALTRYVPKETAQGTGGKVKTVVRFDRRKVNQGIPDSAFPKKKDAAEKTPTSAPAKAPK